MKGLALLILITFGVDGEAARPRIGLVLGGGGARGVAHVGVLKVLEENHVPVDCIAGTSIGALVGAGYAAGRTPDEMAERINNANWSKMFYAKAPRQSYPFRRKQDDSLSLIGLEAGIGDDGQIKIPFAAISTQEIEYFLRELTFGGTTPSFDKLAIPYRAIATDLLTGDMVIMKDGDLVTAMRASMAVPGVFPSVPTKGRILVDGGLIRNLPVDVVRKTCADVVIAVDVGSAPLSREEITGLFSVADQYTRLMMIQNVKPQVAGLSSKDLLIMPQFKDLGSTDFDKGKALEDAGETAAHAVLSQLQKFSVTPEEYAKWQENRKAGRLRPKPLKNFRVERSGWVNEDVVKNELKLETGKDLPMEGFHKRLTSLYASGDFSQLDYELLDSGEGQDLVVLPVVKSWGPNYLSFGLSLGTDFDNSYPWNLTALYRRTWINSLGAEWKTVVQVGYSSLFRTDFYQPLQLVGTAFASPYFRYYRIPLAIWQGGDEVANYKYSSSSVGADIGMGSKLGEVRIGPVYNNYEASRSIGPSVLPDSKTYDYGVRLNIFYDQLDHYLFPTTGQYVDLYGYYSVGSSNEIKGYSIYGLQFRNAIQVGKGNIQFTLKAQNSQGNAEAIADVSWLGGFLNLSSYRYQELIGDQYAYGSAQYYRRMNLLWGSYWGAAVEFGRTFNYFDEAIANLWHYSGTAYLAYDSVLGPMYFAGAYGDNHTWSFYFMLGKQF